MNPEQFLAIFDLPGDVTQLECLGNAGGFSGATLWKCQIAGRQYCLRRWPSEHPDLQRLQFIHQFINWLKPLEFIPDFVPCRTGSSFHYDGNCFIELADWMPGEASFWNDPNQEKLVAAMKTLASIHTRVAEFSEWCSVNTSPGIAQRITMLQRLQRDLFEQLLRKVSKRFGTSIHEMSIRTLELSRPLVSQALVSTLQWTDQPVRIQPCLRDVWHDHVLFDEDRVSGVIDFGAVNFESPAADVARLLGSLVGDAVEQRAIGLAAYESDFPISDDEREMIRSFDLASVVLSGMHWIQWLFVENRAFDDMNRVHDRMVRIVDRLTAAAN